MIQTAETERDAATRKYDAIQREAQNEQLRATNERAELERKIRTLQEQTRELREECEDARTQVSVQERQHKHAYGELEARYKTLHASVDDMHTDLGAKVSALNNAQQRLSQREEDVGGLENEVLRLKAQIGDSDTLVVIKRELSEQVAHIKSLQATNRDQMSELKQLRKTNKSVAVVEEEKRVLQSRVGMMEDLRRELAEAQLQRQILQDEKTGWTSYLESQEELRYATPEDMAKGFIAERMEKLTLVGRLGALQPEVSLRDRQIEQLQIEKQKLKAELEKVKSSGGGSSTNGMSGSAPPDAKARARLERQRNLAVKEVDYLRAQVKTFEAEETEFQPEKADQEGSRRVTELEALIDQYRTEVQTMHEELNKAETAAALAPTTRRKRNHDEDAEGAGEEDEATAASDERVGELRRRTRSLQDTLSSLQTRNATLEAGLHASVSQLKSLRESSRTRVLELRDNPTSRIEAIKQSTLTTLRTENAALLSQLETSWSSATSAHKVVPFSTLESLRQQMTALEAQLAQRDLKQKRLKEIWTSKFREFAEAVAATLGWKVVFMPNGRFKVTSILYPTLVNKDGEEDENSILFDGEQGTMKVSGGPKSAFANEIRPLIEFWVDGRKEVPCFLAACTLEFYEKTTRAASM